MQKAAVSVDDDSLLMQLATSVALLMQLKLCDEATTKKQEITAIARMALILCLNFNIAAKD